MRGRGCEGSAVRTFIANGPHGGPCESLGHSRLAQAGDEEGEGEEKDEGEDDGGAFGNEAVTVVDEGTGESTQDAGEGGDQEDGVHAARELHGRRAGEDEEGDNQKTAGEAR